MVKKSLEEELEKALHEVNSLKNDLSAEIVLDPGGKYVPEEICVPAHEGSNMSDAAYNRLSYDPNRMEIIQVDRWISYGPKITKPDINKRNTSRCKLKEVFESSEWYSVRYSAGKVLEVPDVRTCGERWLDELCKKYTSWKCRKIRFLSKMGFKEDLKELFTIMYEEGNGIELSRKYFTLNTPKKREKFCDFFNINKPEFQRQSMQQDIHLNKEELLEIYNDLDSSRNDIKITGKSLGYSCLRIWSREHKEIIRGLFLALTGSGIVYYLYNYFSK